MAFKHASPNMLLCLKQLNIWGTELIQNGVHTLDCKVTAVLESPCPRNLQELLCFRINTLAWKIHAKSFHITSFLNELLKLESGL